VKVRGVPRGERIRREEGAPPIAWLGLYIFISQKVFMKSFFKSLFPHISVDLFFIEVRIKVVRARNDER
jgi:hypothetical protein